MADQESSPSAGWREVYAAMGVPPAVEPSTDPDGRDCPSCGTRSPRVARRTFRCPRHGRWRPADA